MLDDAAPQEVGNATVLHLPPGAHGMRVGAARNAAARHAIEAGADLLLFLDVDCLAGPDLVEAYAATASAFLEALNLTLCSLGCGA